MADDSMGAAVTAIMDAADDYDSESGGFINEHRVMAELRTRLPEIYRRGFEAGRRAAMLPQA